MPAAIWVAIMAATSRKHINKTFLIGEKLRIFSLTRL